jgi:hypothetical protein
VGTLGPVDGEHANRHRYVAGEVQARSLEGVLDRYEDHIGRPAEIQRTRRAKPRRDQKPSHSPRTGFHARKTEQLAITSPPALYSLLDADWIQLTGSRKHWTTLAATG